MDFTFDGQIKAHIPIIDTCALDLSHDFQIGVFMGESGSGKSTTAATFFGTPKTHQYRSDQTVFSYFESALIAIELLTAVALPPRIGLSPHHVLSDGEKVMFLLEKFGMIRQKKIVVLVFQERVNIARSLNDVRVLNVCKSSEYVIMDEFTSLLDRSTAEKVAKGVSDYIYRHNLSKVVICACHSDILGSHKLQPTFLVNMTCQSVIHYKTPSHSDMEPFSIASKRKWSSGSAQNASFLTRGDVSLERLFARPKIYLYPRRAKYHLFSPLFSKHHYKTGSIAQSARCHAIWARIGTEFDDFDLYDGTTNTELVAFVAFLHYFGVGEYKWREHV